MLPSRVRAGGSSPPPLALAQLAYLMLTVLGDRIVTPPGGVRGWSMLWRDMCMKQSGQVLAFERVLKLARRCGSSSLEAEVRSLLVQERNHLDWLVSKLEEIENEARESSSGE